MSWLKANVAWGHVCVDSPWDCIEPFANIWPLRNWVERDVGNNAVPGPTFNKGWEKVGECEGYENF